MKIPKVIPIYDMPLDIFKMVKDKKKQMQESTGDFQIGYGRITLLVIKDLKLEIEELKNK